MSISTQLPPISLAAASPGLRALAQAAGQTLEARVVGQLANGMTHIQLGQQNLAIALQTLPAPGTVLSLAVQQSQGQLRLTIVSARPPDVAAPAAPAPAATPPAATSVQLSPAGQTARDVQPPPAAASVPAPGGGGAILAPAGGLAAPTGRPGPTGARGAAAPPQAPPAAGAPATAAAPAPALADADIPAPLPAGATTAAAGASGSTIRTSPSPLPAASPVPGSVAASAPARPAPAGGVLPVSAPAPATAPLRPVLPYAAAAAVAPPAAPAGPTGSAAVALPPVQQVAPATAVGQHDAAGARPGSPPAPPAAAGASPAPPVPATPQQALAQAIQQALPRQNSVLALTSALTAALAGSALPEPVAKAAQQVLGRQLPLGGKVDAAAIRAAVASSGVFHEALVAAGRPAAAATDMKAALLGLQRELGQWLGPQGAVERVAQVPPPLRGMTPRARSRDAVPSDLPADPLEAGRIVQERTEHALGRLRLHQAASLPDSAPRAEANWSVDLPVIIQGQPALLQLQIRQDAEDDAVRPEDRGWQVRFAVNLDERGEVGAQISMRGKTTGILLWADEPRTAEQLNAALAELREELGAAGLVSGALVVRSGAPADEPAPPAGAHLVDAVR